MVTAKKLEHSALKAVGKAVKKENEALAKTKEQLGLAEKYRVAMSEIRTLIVRLEEELKAAYDVVPIKTQNITKGFVQSFGPKINEVTNTLIAIGDKVDPKNRSRQRIDKLVHGYIALMNTNILEAVHEKRLDYTTQNVLGAMENIKKEAESVGKSLNMEMLEGERVLDDEIIPALRKSIIDLEDAEQQEQTVEKKIPYLRLVS